MPKYLIQASYTPEGAQGVLSEGGSGRREAVQSVAQALGGSIESFYFAFGSDDVVVILDFPDNVSAVAIGMTVSASGLVSTRTTVLLTPEEIDEASRKSTSYRPPGR